jgi:hypothetical protein
MPEKPPRMRWSTYERWLERIDDLNSDILLALRR